VAEEEGSITIDVPVAADPADGLDPGQLDPEQGLEEFPDEGP
jgi:hypothetical protein